MKPIDLKILLLVLLMLPAGCTTPVNGQVSPNLNYDITLTGKISVKGSEPHTYLCLTTLNRVDFKLIGPISNQIRQKYQSQTLIIMGTVTSPAIGPDMPVTVDVLDFNTKMDLP